MTFRIAIVQPISHPPGADERNVADAVRAVERAAGEGAAFVCFPETYPGPWRMPATFDPTAAIAEAAARNGVHVVFGTIEPIDRKAATAYNLIVMAYPDGRAPARYRRTHPNGPWIYTGGTPGNSSTCRARISGLRHGARQGRARHVQRGLYAGSDARAGVTRRGMIFMPAGKDKTAVGDLADADLGAGDREPGDRGHHAKSLPSRRARAGHGRVARGDRVREHGRRGRASSTYPSIG